jgi:hypothetical protein
VISQAILGHEGHESRSSSLGNDELLNFEKDLHKDEVKKIEELGLRLGLPMVRVIMNDIFPRRYYSRPLMTRIIKKAKDLIFGDKDCLNMLFNEGTKILCLNNVGEEEYIPIENLRAGDFVKTYKNGYRKIDLIGKNTMINNPDKFTECMYKMAKTEENGLLEDLFVTGGHSILVDDLQEYQEESKKIFGVIPKIEDKYFLLAGISKDFVKLKNVDVYNYYHFTLENDGDDDQRFGVWANGILTETPSKTYFLQRKLTSL